MPDPGFVHLHVHSSYSLLEGALTIAQLAELAKADRQPALALTDTDNMFGALEFSDKLAGAGIQPIVGCALAVDFGDQEAPRHPGHGLKLPRARAAGGARGRLPQPDAAHLARLPRDARRTSRRTSSSPALEKAADGLIALTGGPGGPLDLALAAGQAELGGGALRAALPRCSATGSMSSCSATAGRKRSRSSRACSISPTPTASRSSRPTSRSSRRREDYEAHDALICIAEGRLVAEAERRQLSRRASLQVARRDGGAVRRPARGARLDGRDRAALRVPAEDAQADPAALHRRRTARAVDEAAELRRQADEGLTRRIATLGLALGAAPSTTTASGSISSSA